MASFLSKLKKNLYVNICLFVVGGGQFGVEWGSLHYGACVEIRGQLAKVECPPSTG